MKKLCALTVALVFLALSVPAFAHFQMMYSPDSVPQSKKINLKLVFTHPFEAGHTMDMRKRIFSINSSRLTLPASPIPEGHTRPM